MERYVSRHAPALVGHVQPDNIKCFVTSHEPIFTDMRVLTHAHTSLSLPSDCKWQTVVLALNIGKARRLQAGWSGQSTFNRMPDVVP